MDGQQVVSLAVTVTDQMINSMRSTKMWTRFLSIMGFIASGFVILIGIFVSLAGNLLPQAQGGKLPPVLGLIYIFFSIFYIIPSVYLFKYSSALGRYLDNKMESELASALSYQKSFWKFMGLVCLIMMIIVVVGIVAAIVIPLMVRH
ncbi:MAG: DUF5362 family protein [Smithella sp.]|jgi:hypothetical protein